MNKSAADKLVVIPEVIDNDKMKIRITGVDPDNPRGYTLLMSIQNKSADTDYHLRSISSSVNGLQTYPSFKEVCGFGIEMVEVPAGKSVNAELSFSESCASKNIVGEYTDIDLRLSMYESSVSFWDDEKVEKTAFRIYPLGKEKAVKFTRQPKPDDIVLADDEHCTVLAIRDKEDTKSDLIELNYVIPLFFVNKTDDTLLILVDDMKINGIEADTGYADDVGAGRYNYSMMWWTYLFLVKSRIFRPQKVEFTLTVQRGYDYVEDNVILRKNITLYP